MLYARPLLAMLINDGKIPGISSCDLLAALIRQETTDHLTPVRMPVVYCDRCTTQLVRHWYAVNPVMDLELLCLFCALEASDKTDVHTLIGDDL